MERKKRGSQAMNAAGSINEEKEVEMDTQDRLEVMAEVINAMKS